jgi:hypothetical protein
VRHDKQSILLAVGTKWVIETREQMTSRQLELQLCVANLTTMTQ